MNWQTLWWLPNWLAARILDGFAAGHSIPDTVAAWGVVTIVGAAVVFTWLVAGAVHRRRVERELPEPESLLAEDDWLADRTAEIPAPTREAMRKPSPHALSGGVYHGEAVADPDRSRPTRTRRVGRHRVDGGCDAAA